MQFFKYLLFSIILTSLCFAQSAVIHENGTYYFADRIIVKFQNSNSIDSKLLKNSFQKFKFRSEPKVLSKSSNNASSDLDNIYTLTFESPYNPVYVAKEIKKLKEVEWAEPHYLYRIVYTPNDPIYNGADFSKIQHLKQIKSDEAWEINKGSEDVIIAIVDTGVDWDHPDLADNIWVNQGEIDGNGIDDDSNGYIDDIRGWDFGGASGEPDNDPNEDKPDHGTHVAGLAGAVTDNGIGIASIGFNSTIMPVKTSRNNLRDENGYALIAYGYEGIKYAADNGAKVINCSWGGYSYSYFAQAIIDEAISNGALIVAAAGNDNLSDPFYPASYDGVLSVAAVYSSDQKASWSNYGNKVDVTSPGSDVYSTWLDDTYASLSGTSMASPITAGLAGLTFSQFPNYSPLQIGELIRVNSQNVDDLNLSFEKKLGFGRIDAEKTLLGSNSKSIRITALNFIEVGDNDGIYEKGENVKMIFEFTNYLDPIQNLNVSLSSNDVNIELINSSASFSNLNTLQKVTSSLNQFELLIKPASASDVEVNILLTYSDVNYQDFEWITISINPTYQVHTTDNLSITFNSKGSIGFDDYPNNLKGSGLIYNGGPNLMFEGALLYGTSSSTIVSATRDADGNKDEDFNVITPIILESPGELADKETYTKFNDLNADPVSLGIETEVYTYSFISELYDDFIFIRYKFNNTTSNTINNFFAGQYWDFDMDDTSYDDDMVLFDSENNFGYALDNDGDPVNTHIGLALLSDNDFGFFAMNSDGHVNPTISYDGFTDEEKWTALTSGRTFSSSTASDISLLISGGPYTIDPNSGVILDFVVAAGDNHSDLAQNIQNARSKYADFATDVSSHENIPTEFYLAQNYPNPFNPTTTIKYTIPSSSVISIRQLTEKHAQQITSPQANPASWASRNDNVNVSLKVYDILGREVAILVNQKQRPGNYEITWDASNYPSGVYFYSLSAENFRAIEKMLLMK